MSLLRRLPKGIAVGLFFALCFSALVAVEYALQGGLEPLERLHISLGALIFRYMATGTVAGVVGAVLWPLAGRPVTAALCGIAIMILPNVMLASLVFGPLPDWDGSYYGAAAVMSIAYGIAIGRFLFRLHKKDAPPDERT